MTPLVAPLRLLLAPALLVGLGVGCQGSAENSGVELPTHAEAAYMPADVSRVYLVKPGPAETDQHLGWIAQKPVPVGEYEEEVITQVWDLETRAIGFRLQSSGATFEYGKGERLESMGNHDIQRGLQLLYRVDGLLRFQEGI